MPQAVKMWSHASLISSVLLLLVISNAIQTGDAKCQASPTGTGVFMLYNDRTVMTADTGMITTENYPSNFVANRACAYELTGPPGSTIELMFEDYTVGAGVNLILSDGESVFGGDFKIISQTTKPDDFTSKTNRLGIVLSVASTATPMKGIKINYKINKPSDDRALLLDSSESTILLLIVLAGAVVVNIIATSAGIAV